MRGDDMFNIRLPVNLREALRDAAATSRRSVTAEIIYRLTNSSAVPLSFDPSADAGRKSQFGCRLPDGLRDEIRDAAKTAGRSMNAEIVLRLAGGAMPPSVKDGPVEASATLRSYEGETDARKELRLEMEWMDRPLVDDDCKWQLLIRSARTVSRGGRLPPPHHDFESYIVPPAVAHALGKEGHVLARTICQKTESWVIEQIKPSNCRCCGQPDPKLLHVELRRTSV